MGTILFATPSKRHARGRSDRWTPSKADAQQQTEIRKMITKGDKTAADAARLFKIHPATVCYRLTNGIHRE